MSEYLNYPASKQVRMMLGNPAGLKQATINEAPRWYGWPSQEPAPLLVAARIRQSRTEHRARWSE